MDAGPRGVMGSLAYGRSSGKLDGGAVNLHCCVLRAREDLRDEYSVAHLAARRRSSGQFSQILGWCGLAHVQADLIAGCRSLVALH